VVVVDASLNIAIKMPRRRDFCFGACRGDPATLSGKVGGGSSGGVRTAQRHRLARVRRRSLLASMGGVVAQGRSDARAIKNGDPGDEGSGREPARA